MKRIYPYLNYSPIHEAHLPAISKLVAHPYLLSCGYMHYVINKFNYGVDKPQSSLHQNFLEIRKKILREQN